jgi:hypothetical protein
MKMLRPKTDPNPETNEKSKIARFKDKRLVASRKEGGSFEKSRG